MAAKRAVVKAELTINRFTPHDQLPEWLTVEEFCALWGTSQHATYDGIRRGEIPHQRFGRLIRIPKNALVGR